MSDPHEALLETIVRFHNPARVDELCLALMSLIGQSYRPLRVLLVTQRFSAATVATLEAQLDAYRAIDPGVVIDIVNYTETSGLTDARSALINAGIDAARGRYLSVLDYDDTLYPHAYALLVAELQASGAAMAHGGVALKSLTIDPSLPLGLAYARKPQPMGDGLLDVFPGSFCPVHGLLFDRSRIAKADLRTDDTLPIFEDYEWQIRLATRYPVSFARLSDVVGDYRLKDDGSNTVLSTLSTPAQETHWKKYADEIERRRQKLVIETAMQRAIGVSPPRAGLTICALLDGVDDGSLTVKRAIYLEPRVLADENTGRIARPSVDE